LTVVHSIDPLGLPADAVPQGDGRPRRHSAFVLPVMSILAGLVHRLGRVFTIEEET